MSLRGGGADRVDKWPALHSLSRGLVPANLVTTHLRSHGSQFGPGLEESNYPGLPCGCAGAGAARDALTGQVRAVLRPPWPQRQVLWP